MTAPDPGPPRPDAAADAVVEAERARRRAEVFGDVLPESTGDDREPGSPTGETEEWLRSNVPPHHG